MRDFAVAFCLAWIFGTLLGAFGSRPIVVGIGALSCLGLAWLVRLPRATAIATSLLFCIGVLLATTAVTPSPPCTVVEPAEVIITAAQHQFERSQYTGTTADGCMILITTARFPTVGLGDGIRLTGGKVRTLNETRDFNTGYAKYLKRRGIGLTWQFAHLEIVTVAQTQSLAKQWYQHLCDRVRQILPEPDASLVVALVLADQGQISPEIVEQFRRTGVSHVLSVSGLHISLLATIFLGLLRLLPLPVWLRSAVLIILLWSYIWFIGAPIAAVRAGWFVSLALMGYQMRLLISLPTVVLLTVVSVVSFNPQLWHDISWQLSLTAVLGIWLSLFVGKPLLEYTIVPKWLGSLIVVTLGAGLATGPLAAFHFGLVSPISFLANLLIVPASSLVLIFGLLVIAVVEVTPLVALVIAYPLHLILVWMQWVMSGLASVPGAYIAEVTISFGFMLIYYVVLVLGAVLILWYQRRNWREIWA